jgi:hypothetical protein
MKEFNILGRLLALIAVAMLMALVACTSTPAPIPAPETIASPLAPEGTPMAEPASKPAPSEQVPRISIEELLQKMESNASIVIADARPTAEYDAGHIKGAVSAPLSVILEGQWLPPAGKEVILY